MGAGGSAQEIRAQSGPYKTRRVPELPKHKLPADVIEGFTNYMKVEIEKSQEKQKRNRQTSVKQPSKLSNPPLNAPQTQLSGVTPIGMTATSAPVPPQNPNNPKIVSNEAEHKKNIEDVKLNLEHVHHEEEKVDERKHTDESRIKESDKVSFKVETEEREIEVYRNPESPRPAPPVFDENLEPEAVYNKEERKAKEKEAVELAQKAAHEQKLKVEQELGEKKNELNQLENKYENIAAKYMNKK